VSGLDTSSQAASRARRGGFSGELWALATPTYEAILGQAFLRGLVDGTLSAERFRFFVVQDIHYLGAFSRALALIAARAPTGEQVGLLAGGASRAIAVEQEMHASFLDELELDATAPRSPTTIAYSDFVLAHAALDPFVGALASVLACYWVYWEIGASLIPEGSPVPRYQRWIDAYGDQDYGAAVTALLDLADDAGRRASAAERNQAKEVFATACRYEWCFWDAAWRQETWRI